VIDKLPFAPPDDPLIAARLRQLKDDGGNPFRDWQLPQAAIALKQGAGRLIRTETDRGVLMIGDPRLVDKPYGKTLWRSLPPMKRTRELSDVEAFFGIRSQESVGSWQLTVAAAIPVAARRAPLTESRCRDNRARCAAAEDSGATVNCQLPTDS